MYIPRNTVFVTRFSKFFCVIFVFVIFYDNYCYFIAFPLPETPAHMSIDLSADMFIDMSADVSADMSADMSADVSADMSADVSADIIPAPGSVSGVFLQLNDLFRFFLCPA